MRSHSGGKLIVMERVNTTSDLYSVCNSWTKFAFTTMQVERRSLQMRLVCQYDVNVEISKNAGGVFTVPGT